MITKEEYDIKKNELDIRGVEIENKRKELEDAVEQNRKDYELYQEDLSALTALIANGMESPTKEATDASLNQ